MRFRSLVAVALIPTFVLGGCGASPMKGASTPSDAANAAGPRDMAPTTAAGKAAPDAEMAAAPSPMSIPMTAPAEAPAATAGRAPSPPPPAPAAVAQATTQAAKPSPPLRLADKKKAEQSAIAGAAPEPPGTEDYRDYGVNPDVDPAKDRLSTFAIDVDTASYAISRRKINEGALPPFQAVRLEEFVNAFDYGYAAPARGAFTVHLAAAPSPYAKGRHLIRVGVQGKRISKEERMPVHLVYLVDTSGSMQSPDKIELVKKSLRLLTGALKAGDTVALCTYAGSVREVLAPTGVDKRDAILKAIDDLTANGSTAMASGIDLAYRLAERTLVKGHVNRVVIASDGDANVGATSHQEILKMIGRYKEKGITLSTLGFGNGNYKDTMMEQLANQGDGNYSYIDSEEGARKIFTEQVNGMLQVIARDVKIQVEFDPAVVAQYRLLGYENRDVADKDFRNDKVDGGEIGAGHNVTAIYDVVLKSTTASPLVVRIRHKKPLGTETAEESAFRLDSRAITPSFGEAPVDMRFATAVAGFAELLRKSPAAKGITFAQVERIARETAGAHRERQEFIELVRKAAALAGEKIPPVTVAR